MRSPASSGGSQRAGPVAGAELAEHRAVAVEQDRGHGVVLGRPELRRKRRERRQGGASRKPRRDGEGDRDLRRAAQGSAARAGGAGQATALRGQAPSGGARRLERGTHWRRVRPSAGDLDRDGARPAEDLGAVHLLRARGGTTNEPSVVARARYRYWYMPAAMWSTKKRTRSSRISRTKRLGS